jgi:hypothetical protein
MPRLLLEPLVPHLRRTSGPDRDPLDLGCPAASLSAEERRRFPFATARHRGATTLAAGLWHGRKVKRPASPGPQAVAGHCDSAEYHRRK